MIAYHNGWLYTVPEMPSSQPGPDFLVRKWNLANLPNVTLDETYDETNRPVMAHGYVHLGNYLCLMDNWPPEIPFSFRVIAPGVNQRTSAPGFDGSYTEATCSNPGTSTPIGATIPTRSTIRRCCEKTGRFSQPGTTSARRV